MTLNRCVSDKLSANCVYAGFKSEKDLKANYHRTVYACLLQIHYKTLGDKKNGFDANASSNPFENVI